MPFGSAQHMLKMQCNEDTILLDSPLRFAIDKNTQNPTCYKVTQNDNSSYNYGKGLCCVTVTEDKLDKNKDKFIKLNDGNFVWICDYMITTPSSPSLSNTTKDLSAKILGNCNLKIGVFRTYSVNFSWNVISHFDVDINKHDNWIKLLVNNDSLIGESFLLQIYVDSECIEEIKISISDVT